MGESRIKRKSPCYEGLSQFCSYKRKDRNVKNNTKSQLLKQAHDIARAIRQEPMRSIRMRELVAQWAEKMQELVNA